MCACDSHYVCMTHRGTQHDHWSDSDPDPREDDLAARYSSGSESTVEAADWRVAA